MKTCSEQDNGKSMMLATGELIELRLHENPTTGYRWHLADWDHSVLEIVRDEYRPSHTSGHGGGGEHIWHFIARHKGNVSVQLAQHRSWETARPAALFTLEITVT